LRPEDMEMPSCDEVGKRSTLQGAFVTAQLPVWGVVLEGIGPR
jgi:hypothetical protein